MSALVRVLLLVLSITLPAFSAAPPTTYQVEILIFTHDGGSLAGGGVPAQPLTGIESAVELTDGNEGNNFEALPATELALATAKSILQQSGRYVVLLHTAWRQPGLDERAARAVHLHGGVDYRSPAAALPPLGYENPDLYQRVETLEQLDGTVKVVLAGYLHVLMDFVLREPIALPAIAGTQPARRANSLYQFPIQHQRRVRSKELHYFDHPLLGILVQITPVEEEPQVQAPPAADSVD